MSGIGRECGSARFSPCCKRRSRNPVSRRAASDIGGVLISPWSTIRLLPSIKAKGYTKIDIESTHRSSVNIVYATYKFFTQARESVVAAQRRVAYKFKSRPHEQA